ncbi:MAG: hypothetical protein OEY59_13685 [Deltaproteobacteria bacterium]|nr:hypothetical protein [Deltaproteobacteria bacterium]
MKPSIAKFYHNTIQQMRGWDYRSALSQLEESQWLPLEVVKKQRLKLLKKLITHCYANVPYYRTQWENISFSPEDIQNEEDIFCLPIISKDTLREHYNSFLSEITPDYEIWKTSGSTGKPFPFCLDKNTIIYNTFGNLARGKRWWGGEEGNPEGMIWSGVSDVSGTLTGHLEAIKRRLSWELKNIKLIDVYSLDLLSIQKGYEAFQKHQPLLLRSISSGLYRFCAGLEQLGLDGKKMGVKGAIFTGEGFPESQRKFVERVLGCPTICEYGCTELGVIGFECRHKSIHLSHENYILEFLKDGRPAQAGETAELVVTNLRNYASPLIRYAVGDFVVPSARVCECGRTLPIIEHVQGRLHDSVITPDGRTIHGLFFTHLFDKYDQVHQFRVVQEDIVHLTIELVSFEHINGFVLNDLKNAVEKQFGPQVVVNISQVSSIPTSARGKTPWIISKIS